MTTPNRTVTERTTCRACDSPYLTPLFSLGEQYVSDFVERDKVTAGVQCPLELVLCPACTLVQLKHTAPQDFLYTRHYWYRSGVTDTMREALRDVTRTIEGMTALESGDVVLDIGSNDGTLLRSYETDGLIRVGVEPATNLRAEGSVGLDYLIQDFWGAEGLDEDFLNCHGKARVVTACGMFYDLEDPNLFVAGVVKALHPNGVFVAQLMCLRNMLETYDVGNLAHEHLEHYSLRSLRLLFEKHGLEIFRIDMNRTNGQSYRLFVQHRAERQFGQPMIHVAEMEKSEAADGLYGPDYYQGWLAKVAANRDRCVGFVRDAAARGKSVWVYGASTKGNVILQWYGLNNSLITGAADRSPEKAGKFTVGTGIPVFSEKVARTFDQDYFLVLPYAFLQEFVERESQRGWRKNGGRFLVPLPEFRVV